MNETDVVARGSASDSTGRKTDAAGLEPCCRYAQVVDPQPDVIERWGVDLRTLFGIDGTHEVDLDCGGAEAEAQDRFVDVFGRATVFSAFREPQEFDPQVLERGSIKASDSDLLEAEDAEGTRRSGHGPRVQGFLLHWACVRLSPPSRAPRGVFRGSLMFRVFTACLWLVGPGCSRLVSQHPASRHEEAGEPVSPSVAPRLASAHFRVEAGTSDEILLVFSERIEASTLVAHDFVVVRADGHGVVPRTASLAPANERDEHRSVVLRGDFVDAGATEPVAVHVIGGLFTVSGEPLRGLDAPVRGSDLPTSLVMVESVAPQPGRCAGAMQVLRTYWSGCLGRLDPGENNAFLASIRLYLADGRELHPVAIDDHGRVAMDTVQSLPRAESEMMEPSAREFETRPRSASDFASVHRTGEDNVLDLCLDVGIRVSRVVIENGNFVDDRGRRIKNVDHRLGASNFGEIAP